MTKFVNKYLMLRCSVAAMAAAEECDEAHDRVLFRRYWGERGELGGDL